MKKVLNSQVFHLWRNYQGVSFRHHEKLTIPWSDFQIVTAYNPRSVQLPTQANLLKMQKMQRYLESKNIQYRRLECGGRNFVWSEPSFAVKMETLKCINLASLYQQNAIYEIRAGELWLVPLLLKQFDEVCLGVFEDYL